jgi:hypothetical protein
VYWRLKILPNDCLKTIFDLPIGRYIGDLQRQLIDHPQPARVLPPSPLPSPLLGARLVVMGVLVDNISSPSLGFDRHRLSSCGRKPNNATTLHKINNECRRVASRDAGRITGFLKNGRRGARDT